VAAVESEPACEKHINQPPGIEMAWAHAPGKRFCGGGAAPDAKELVAAICLSVLGDNSQVAELLGQDWVDTWHGWAEMETAGSDAAAFAVAERFLRIAGANVPARLTSNRQRLQDLEARGLVLKVASSHGVNNCLIDSLLLGLMATGVAPKKYAAEERKALCAACREELLLQHGTPPGIYLDGHRDTPRILSFFLQKLWQADIAVRVCFYDCLPQEELGPAGEDLSYVDFTWGQRVIYERYVLHVYNHTDVTGRGYHFDALVPRRAGLHGTPTVAPAGGHRVSQDKNVATRGARNSSKAGCPSRDHLEAKAMAENAMHGEPPWPEVPPQRQVEGMLGDFLRSRGVSLRIGSSDAAEVVAAWHDREALVRKLHTLLQAGLVYADSGMHAARRLVDQWLAYASVRTQGHGRRLNEAEAAEVPKTQEERRGARNKENGKASQEMEQAKEAAQARGEKRKQPTAAPAFPGQGMASPLKRLRGKQPLGGPGTKLEESKGDAEQRLQAEGAASLGQAKDIYVSSPAAESQHENKIGKEVPTNRLPEATDADSKTAGGPPARRLRTKTPATLALEKGCSSNALPGEGGEESSEEEDMFRLRCEDPSTSNDPRQVQERKVMLLSECLAEKPTLPWHCQNETDRLEAYDLPRARCSFKECSFSADNDAAILEHILEAHKPTLTEAAGEEASVEAMVSLYCAALTWKCQGGAPVANASIDRRALQQFQKAREGDEIVSFVLFVPGNTLTYAVAATKKSLGHSRFTEKTRRYLASRLKRQRSC